MNEATAIGRSIQAVDSLLEYHLPANSTEADHTRLSELRKAVVAQARTTHLYPWVQGRLRLEVETLNSVIRDTRPEPAREKEMRVRVAFLHKLMFEIDAPH